MGSLRDALRQDGEIEYMSLAIAAWFGYLKAIDDQGNLIQIDDPMADILTQRARSGGDPRSLLGLSEIFGDLSHEIAFCGDWRSFT